MFEFLSHGNYNSAMKLNEKEVEVPQRRHFTNRNVINQRGPIKVYELDHNQLLEKLLLKRENELRRRRDKLEHLLKWKADLDQEEKYLKQLEKELVNKSSGPNNHVGTEKVQLTELKSTPSESSKSNIIPNVIEIDRLSQIESSISRLQEVEDDVEDVVTLSGTKLNKLWSRLCGRNEVKYEPNKLYELNKREVENIYEEAKLVVIGNFQNKNYVNQMLEKTQVDQSSGMTTSQSNDILSTQSTNASVERVEIRQELKTPSIDSTTPPSYPPILNKEINLVIDEHNISENTEKDLEKEDEPIRETSPVLEIKQALENIEDSSVSSQEQKQASIGSSDEGVFYFEDQELNRSLSEETIEGKDDAEKTHIEVSFNDSLIVVTNPQDEVEERSNTIEEINEKQGSEDHKTEDHKEIDKDDGSDVSYSDTFDKLSIASEDHGHSNHLQSNNKTLEPSITSTENEKSIPEVLESIEGSAISEEIVESGSETPIIAELLQTTDLDKQDDQEVVIESNNGQSSTSTTLVVASNHSENFIEKSMVTTESSGSPKTISILHTDYKLPDIISEAEVLRIQQMQIEQEIEQLQQQVPLSYQIPKKPPPPYTLRPEETDTNQFPSREIVHKLVMQRVETLYNTNHASGSITRYPIEGSTANIYERIIIDMAEEMFYSFERYLEIEKHAGVLKNSLAFFDPPNELECLKENAVRKVDKICSPIIDVQLEVELISARTATNKKKRDLVDEILISELASDDSNWSYFDAEEKIVKNDLVNVILKQLVHEAVHDILETL